MAESCSGCTGCPETCSHGTNGNCNNTCTLGNDCTCAGCDQHAHS
jgi:hypothetical protein